MPTHFLTVYKRPKWAISVIDQFRRSFLGRGKDSDHVKGDTTWSIGRLA
jgi:hypothetical protein